VKPVENRMNEFSLQRTQYLTEIASDRHIVHKIVITDHSNVGITTGSNTRDFSISILNEIEELLDSDSIQSKDINSLLKLSKRLHEMGHDNTAASTIEFENLVSDYESKKNEIVRNKEIFDDLYQDYYAEYIAWVSNVNKLRLTPLPIEPKGKCKFKSIEALDNERKQIAKESKRVMVSNEIRKQINEVMDMFGYETAEDVEFSNNPAGAHYVCESTVNETALHISVTDDNKLLMEVVGFERALDKNNSTKATITNTLGLSNEEISLLINEQRGFCNIHPKIVEELRKRGVLLNEHARTTPNSSSCKKIKLYSDNHKVTSRLFNPVADESGDDEVSGLMQQSIK
jgi:hypothetical protein